MLKHLGFELVQQGIARSFERLAETFILGHLSIPEGTNGNNKINNRLAFS